MKTNREECKLCEVTIPHTLLTVIEEGKKERKQHSSRQQIQTSPNHTLKVCPRQKIEHKQVSNDITDDTALRKPFKIVQERFILMKINEDREDTALLFTNMSSAAHLD